MVAIATLIVLVSGVFNTLGQRFLMDDEYGKFRHPAFINLGMFIGEYFNFIIWIILNLIPFTAKKITQENYKLVISSL
jgi:hypothetical protein